jgi:hypothetical protein
MFRLDVSETRAGGRIGDTDQNLAGRALNLPPGELRLAFQWLVAVGAIEFEFVRVHSLHPLHAQTGREKYMKDLSILSVRGLRM